MIQTIYKSDFTSAFHKAGRGNNFTYEGLNALYDYIEDYEDSTGEQIELDVIALCLEYNEYEDLAEFQEDYGDDYQSIEEIEHATQVIMIMMIVSSFMYFRIYSVHLSKCIKGSHTGDNYDIYKNFQN